MELAALERLEISIDLYWENCCYHSSDFNFEWIFFILAFKKGTYQGFDEFEFRKDLIT